MASKRITLTITPELEDPDGWTTVRYPLNMSNTAFPDALSFSFTYIELFRRYDFHYNDSGDDTMNSTETQIHTVPELDRMLDEATNLTMIEGMDEYGQRNDAHRSIASPTAHLERKINTLSEIVSKMIDILETITSKVSDHGLERLKDELAQ